MRAWRWSRLTTLLGIFLVLLPLFSPAAAMQQAGPSLDPANMDLSVDPAEDFYRFANGGWLDRTEIPPDEAEYGVFHELRDLTNEQLLTVLNDAEAGGQLREGSDEWKVSELYRQGNDMDARNEAGMGPIQSMLDEIDAISTIEALHIYHETAYQQWLTGIFGVYADVDFMDSTVYVPYLTGPVLGLPSYDYYLEANEENDAIRDAYLDMLTELLVHGGYTDAQARDAAEGVYEFERRVAKELLSPEEAQDISLLYNPMSLGDLESAYPLMDWQGFFDALGFGDANTMIALEKRYLDALGDIVAETPLDTLKDFYKVEVLLSFANYLDEDIGATVFDFYGGFLTGAMEQRPLEERTLEQTNTMMPDAIGRLYVDAYFPPEAKEEITALVDAEIAAFRIRLENNPWMSDETRAAAIEKLDAISVKVGYPDQWHSYEAVEIGDSYVESFLTAAVAEWERNLAKVGEPVDRGEWIMSPQTVNAYYNPTMNEIVFPAAILQPPFFEYGGDPAANFGGIGIVIGHELTHGFDITGSQFDGQGTLTSWWTEADYATFDTLNQRVADQYNDIEVLPGVTVNGQLTVGENVADLGGNQIAYDALLIYLRDEGGMIVSPVASPISVVSATPVVAMEFESLTPQQRFFLAASTVWRSQTRDEALRNQVMVDSHSPASVRGVVPLQNNDAFYEAFDIQPGDPMYLPPEERIVIW